MPTASLTTSALAVSCLACALGGCSRSDDRGALDAGERQRIPGRIAFVSERAGHKDVWIVKATGEETRLTRGPEDEYPAAPSPDGSALLVVAAWERDGAHREQLRLVPLSGDGEPVPLHAPLGRARNPSWAPGGDFIVAETDVRGFSDIVRMAPRPGSEPQWLATAAAGNFEPAVSPDGTQVAFVTSRDGDPELYVMDADGENQRRLTAFHKEDWAPVWSPDGEWIAFASNREGRARIFVVRPDGTGTRAISGSADTGDERHPAWSPDSRKLAFVGRRDDGNTRIWVAPVSGGEPAALTDGKSLDDQPAWSPDGKYLVFVSERAGDPDLYLMRADGSGPTRLTRAEGADWLPRWLAR